MDQQTQATPEQMARLKAAADDEQQALNGYLQNRVIMLNAEVRLRDERIAELEHEVQEAYSRGMGDAMEAAADEAASVPGDDSTIEP